MLDIVIIGSGPAGLSAAIYGSRSGLDILVIEKISHGVGQIAEADCINNYLGFSSIRGFELGMQFRTHAEACGVRFQESEAIKLERTDACWKIYSKDGSCIQSKTVIYAAGASHRHLNVFGEEALIGKGVSYCATCDGTFYKGKDVAVIGGGNTAVGDALYLSDLCHKVYLIHRQNSFRANTESLTNLKSKKNVHIITPAKVTKIIGEEAMGVFAVQVETNNSTIPNEALSKTSDIPNETLSRTSDIPNEALSITSDIPNEALSITSDIPVSGVFIAVGRQPATDILQDIVPLNEQGYIVADENGRTSLDNFFAAGDVRSKENRQIITAAADGANAAISAEKYLTARI